MNPDIHPHWKSTRKDSTPSDASTAPLQREMVSDNRHENRNVQRVRINRSSSSPFFLSLFLGVGGLVALTVVFMAGVLRIKADITEGLSPDVIVKITQEGFEPQEARAEVGNLIEWQNETTSAEKIVSDIALESMPSVSSSYIPPGQSFRFEVPAELAGTTVTYRSILSPTKVGTLVVGSIAGGDEAAEEAGVTEDRMEMEEGQAEEVDAEEGEEEQDISSPHAVAPAVPSQPLSTTSERSSTQTEAAPSPAQQPKKPVVPFQAAGSVQQRTPIKTTPVVNIGDAISRMVQTGWPDLLRINRFTVGSSYVPSFSPTDQIPVHVIANMQQQIHAAAMPQTTVTKAPPARLVAKKPPARKQPDTGPALWVVTLISLLLGAFLFRKQEKKV